MKDYKLGCCVMEYELQIQFLAFEKCGLFTLFFFDLFLHSLALLRSSSVIDQGFRKPIAIIFALYLDGAWCNGAYRSSSEKWRVAFRLLQWYSLSEHLWFGAVLRTSRCLSTPMRFPLHTPTVATSQPCHATLRRFFAIASVLVVIRSTRSTEENAHEHLPHRRCGTPNHDWMRRRVAWQGWSCCNRWSI